MQFRLLGPLEVAEPHWEAVVGGVRQRSLLAIQLVHANEVAAPDDPRTLFRWSLTGAGS